MNKNLLAALDELSAGAKDKYRKKAYREAAAAVRKLGYEIDKNTISRLSRPKVVGIGAGILAKITEFVSTGRIGDLDKLREEVSAHQHAYHELSTIWGAGPATIERWIAAGIDSIAKLRKAVATRAVTLTTMQKYGLRYHADLNTRIPRAEVETLGKYIGSTLVQCSNNPGKTIFVIAGSYRRGMVDSGDIDILVSNMEHFDGQLLYKFTNLLSADPNFIDVVSIGQERVTFLYVGKGLVRQIDILNIAPESYWAAVLYFTGDAEFNEKMRGHARSIGFRLNQAGLYKYNDSNLELVSISSEKEIFDALGLKYVEPSERTGRAIVETKN